MKNVWIFPVVAICALVPSCEKYKPPMEALPGVTLVERKPREGTVLLRFCFQDMNRFDWKKRVLTAQLIKADGKPQPGGPFFLSPSPEFSVVLVVGKVPNSDSVLFAVSWGKSTNEVIGNPVSIELPSVDGQPNQATVAGTADLQVTQILHPCTGPNIRIPFDPDRGLDLVRLEPSARAGDLLDTKPEPRVLRIYAVPAPPSAKP